jgi:hypothetical protein
MMCDRVYTLSRPEDEIGVKDQMGGQVLSLSFLYDLEHFLGSPSIHSLVGGKTQLSIDRHVQCKSN